MKKLFVLSSLYLLASATIVGQQTSAQLPHLLNEPSGWEFERFALPPEFAPAFPFKGAEELRFSPGMFKKDSADYFTYAFVAELENITSVSKDDITNYLSLYFKGLCSSTAKNRKLEIDTTKVTVSVDRKKGTAASEVIYNAFLNIFGVFADGAAVKLTMEIKVLPDAATKKTYLFFIASPQPKTHEVWKKLYELQKKFSIPH